MIYVFGDSHAKFNFINCPFPIKILEENSITMYRVGRDKEIIHFNKQYLGKDNIFVFCFGEIDCRAHITKQVQLGREKEEIIKSLVDSYLNTLRLLITEYDKIIICEVPPATRESDYHILHNNFPFYDTDKERVENTLRMNSYLKEATKNTFVLLEYHEYYARADGTLKYELSDQCVHIKENTYIHEQLFNIIL